jgi:deferrochelatase/peroxidase EfeB
MALDLADIQGNLLRGYRSANARHFALSIGNAQGGAAFIASLVSGNESKSPQVTTAEEWEPDTKPPYTLNVGITYDGLQKLGVPAGALAAFPAAFREGAAQRALDADPDYADGVGLGDIGESGPADWILGGTKDPAVDIVLSLYTHERRRHRLDELTATLRGLFAANALTEISAHDANALPNGEVHFGYRDGIAQPQIEGAPGRDRPDMQPQAGVGDFLLGRDYVNVYGGNYLEAIPPELGDNATYGAFLILRQDVRAFEAFLTHRAVRWGLDRELIAAKLLGRWRNGTPLTLVPDGSRTLPDDRLNEFDYAPGDGHEAFYDDVDGRRCPVGAHIRRLNPRGSLVMGKPHSRRLVRRGMPYGPPYDPAEPDDGAERGLIGLFICGDLEMQFEFILRVWANEDIATHGLRGTRDPLIGAQPSIGGEFVIRTDDSRDPIVLTGLPRLVQTRGSVYCLIPGIGGLRHLSSLPAA